MTKLLTALLNALIEEGYSFATIKERNNYKRYRLVNERTSCAVMVTEELIDISLCLLEDVANGSYDSERRFTVECEEDLPAAKELIRLFEDWCDEASEKTVKIEVKKFWEIPGFYAQTYHFSLPLDGEEHKFIMDCYEDQDVHVYSVNGKVVGYYQPKRNVAMFRAVGGRIHYCENLDTNGYNNLLIHLKNLPNGIQWTMFIEDGTEEKVFIKLV